MAGNLSTWLFAGLIGSVGIAPWASGSILTVGASGTYTTIADAWAAAASGDTIRFIDSGTYTSSATLNLNSKSNLTVESASGQRATIDFAGGTAGFYVNADGFTVQNLNLNTQGAADSIITAASPPVGNSATITNINFTRSVGTTGYGAHGLVQSADNMSISYSTFKGVGDDTNEGRGVGISWSVGTTLAVDHCSFDNFMIPINQGASSGTTDITVTNSAFGNWRPSGWAGGITTADSGATGAEDYNASYGPMPLLVGPGVITSGGHSFTVGSYSGIFAGDTSVGNWAVNPALYTAAGDGTTIGAWQAVPEPTGLSLIALGAFAFAARRRRSNA